MRIMGYPLSMSSSFVYQPHVHQSDGTVITPDILVEHVYVADVDGVPTPVPVSRLTSAAVFQQPAGAPVGTPAVVLVAASYGFLVSVGAILDGFLPVARAAWRFDDIGDGYGDLTLRSWTVHDGKRTVFVSEKLSALLSPANAMKALGNAAGLKPGTAVFICHPAPLGESLPVEQFEIALDAGDTKLQYRFGIEAVG